MRPTENAARRPFCNTWPWPNSDLDLVTEEQNAEVHRARGCCDGWWPEEGLPTIAAGGPSAVGNQPPLRLGPLFEHVSDLTPEEANGA